MEKDKAVTNRMCFAEVEDSRVGPSRLHKLENILAIAICGVIFGANDWVNIHLLHFDIESKKKGLSSVNKAFLVGARQIWAVQ